MGERDPETKLQTFRGVLNRLADLSNLSLSLTKLGKSQDEPCLEGSTGTTRSQLLLFGK